MAYRSDFPGKFKDRTRFDMTHTKIGTFGQGRLYPVACEEVLPGDSWKFSPEVFLRALPLAIPAMTDLTVYLDYFFVPIRLVWDNWEKFITGDVDGQDNTTRPFIGLQGADWAVGSLADYFGLPVGQGGGAAVSALPFRCMVKIYNDWYRDNNLQTEVPMSKGDGSDNTTYKGQPLGRCWEKDYFTTALLSPQRGPAISMPLGDSAPVTIDTGSLPVKWHGADLQAPVSVRGKTDSGNDFVVTDNTLGGPQGLSDQGQVSTGGENVYANADADAQHTLTGDADLTGATATTVNDLRLAFQIQRWAELNARAGVRLIEYIYAHFGVRSSDARLQRSERVFSHKGQIVISEVLQTSESGTTPQGNMAGHGYARTVGRVGRYTAEEHGFLLCIMSILPKTVYCQGIPRMFSRATRFDYYVPAFAHLGEQAVLNKELYYRDDQPNDDAPFGYVPRWQELRYRENSLAGLVRPNQSLQNWTQARIFSQPPTLNDAFVLSNPATRIFADTDPSHDCFIAQVKQHMSVIRQLPLSGDPGLIDHI